MAKKFKKPEANCNICEYRPLGYKRDQAFMGSEFGMCGSCDSKTQNRFRRDPKKRTRRPPKSPVIQKHHVIYQGDLSAKKQRDVIRKLRSGVHNIVTKIRRYKSLTDEEINTIKIEAELKREFK